MSQDKPVLGPASGSPVSELVGRLEEVDATAWPSVLVPICAEAAKALRALEEENEKAWAFCRNAIIGQEKAEERYGSALDDAKQKSKMYNEVSEEADQLREWLEESIQSWLDWCKTYEFSDFNAASLSARDCARISEIRSKMEKAGG